MAEFRMPSLGADMDVGTIVEWRVGEGDTVRKGDIIAVVDTEKSDIEVEVFEDGVIEELLVEPGVEVPVGTPLARIGSLDDASPERPPAPPRPAPTGGHDEHAFVAASPRARRAARRAGIDLAEISGTGPGDAVVTSDVEEVAAGSRPSPQPERSIPVERATRGTAAERPDRREAMRRATGELMARSKREIPHYYLSTTIDLSSAMAWLRDRNERCPVDQRLLPVALLLKATAVAVHDVPRLNGFWTDGFEASERVHLGVAVALRGGGLVAPAIHDADRCTVDELMTATKDLVTRARAGRLRSSEMSDSTITVTNLGDQGVEEVFGVIYPPQVALVGFGRVVERPWAQNGMVGVRPTVRATLAADHRVTDGHEGARFLSAIEQWLQDPEA
jgi:pyruvate dehydrogenase E2 component (dihydrolipoamide acetyltransferase)